jgi:hypothetical protein
MIYVLCYNISYYNVLVLRFYLCTLYRYSLFAYCKMISFLVQTSFVSYLCIVPVTLLLLLLLLLVLYYQDSFCTVPTVILKSSISTLVDLRNAE